MTAEKFRRKLTAILSADVKGYSRLMGADEEETVETLKAHREVMGSSIQHHRGRVIDTVGDSVLAEFASVVDAVQCAVEIQQVLRAKNALLPEDRRMEFRIGINLGDVIEEGNTIYGDGVNIAARLESLAEPGGICISEDAYRQIENKLPLRYDYLGEHEVKNISKPIRVYCARIEADAGPSKLSKEKKPARKGLSKTVMAIVAVFVIAGAAMLYQFVLRPSPSKTEVASREKMAFALPDVPSIFVLPFANVSEDPKQEFLVDGITASIITALLKVPGVFVINRPSSFSYKGKPVKVKQVSEEFGVRYVLEGSVQRSADRIRIHAELIDALTGHNIWAERYDRDLQDIFALQDEITMKILTATQVKLTVGEPALTVAKYSIGKQGLDCYLKYWEGTNYLWRGSMEDNNVARRIAEEAIAMCPESPMGYYLLGSVHLQAYRLGNTKSPRETIEKGIELTQKLLALDDSIAEGHVLLSSFYSIKREYEKAIAEGERAVSLAPRQARTNSSYGNSLLYAGRAEEAIPLLQNAIRFCPISGSTNFTPLGNALRNTGRFEEAVMEYKKAIQRSPDNILAHINLAACYSMMGREKEAHAEAAEVLRINSKYSLDSFAKTQAYKDQSETDKIISALRKAGLK